MLLSETSFTLKLGEFHLYDITAFNLIKNLSQVCLVYSLIIISAEQYAFWNGVTIVGAAF